MRSGGRCGGAWLAACVVAGTAFAQDVPLARRVGFYDEIVEPGSDRVEAVFSGGILLRRAPTEVRAERGILIYDRDRRLSALEAARRSSGLPRRGFEPPATRRALTLEAMQDRLERFIGSLERAPREVTLPPEFDPGFLRSFYFEGGVEFVHDGRIVLRADRVYYSVVDDRAVFDQVELRLFRADESGKEQVVVVRADELVREGVRTTGRDVSVTTCSAGEPHWEMFVGETELIERGDEFEIRSRDNWLAFGGRRLIPLPDAKQFTGSPSNYWIQSVRGGYSSQQGVEVQIDFGGPFNRVGGWLHEGLTGRPAEEFRGDWRIGTGWIEERGFPLDGELTYGAEGVYEGRMRGFFLDDRGEDFREIQSYIDGTPIDEDVRALFDTRNRVELGERTLLDLTAFYAGDPAVLSEFYPDEFIRGEEIPESSAQLRTADGNRQMSAIGRWNIAEDGFSYDDSRALAPSFVESEPNVAFDWISQPILELPGETPLMLTSSSSAGRFRSRYDERFATPVDDDTTRLDQELELSTPFQAGPFGVRAFTSGRFTYFSDTVSGESDERWAFSAGASIGTRLARTWRWRNGASDEALRHVISPTVRYEHVFKVDGEPDDYHQFDRIDAIDEGSNIRVGLLQRFQRRTRASAEAPDDLRELLWLDLAQYVSPNSSRDNGGDRLGLFEFEVILRPAPRRFVVDDLTFLVEGEQDWNDSQLRTFNSYLAFGALGIRWYGGYREDFVERGTIAFGAELPVRGRWRVGGNGSWDLERDEFQDWVVALIRRDHDWEIAVALRRDELVDETSFSVDFVPDFGGLFRMRGSRAGVGDAFSGFRLTEW